MITKFFIITLIIVKDVCSQQCQLSAANMNKSWVFAVATPLNKVELLHRDILQDQEQLYLICKNNDVIRLRCNHGRMSNIPAGARCSRRIKATINPIDNEKCRQNNGQMYDIRYALPIGEGVQSLYQVCYSGNFEAPIYSRHLVYRFNLAASPYQRPQFVTGGVVSQSRADSFETANIFNSFVRLLGYAQNYVKSPRVGDRIMDRGHLVNSQDFLTYDQMDETFKYINVMAQFGSINRSNWKKIENWIHKLPHTGTETFVEVVTGTFGVLELPHSQTQRPTPMFLMANNKNPIPKWSYKVAKYEGKCHAFVTYNNPFGRPNLSESPCVSVPCPLYLNFNNTITEGGASDCCDPYRLAVIVGDQANLCRANTSRKRIRPHS
uniref:DNA/RNA non-specific endonuclease/pyrophosphatase/phosphodiesterase domain-containing protein n=1 Tax=Stomoxys calcitrans TaxID=35570 RepID=A0A1I8NXQ5_STOCA